MAATPERTPTPRQSREEEAERWSWKDQLQDWGLVLAIIAVHVGWMLVVFLTEPGIR